MEERLNKFIAANGFSSRRKIDEFIIQGRVTVNGKTVLDLGHKINTETDKVAVDGERIKQSDKKIYLMMNKPDGVVTTVSDDKHRPTVIDVLNTKTKIFPIGRLDFHTTGLLLLTNDGEFANKLMNPAFKVWKTYDVKLSRPLEQKHRLALEKGIRLEGRYTLPAKISVPNEKDYSKVTISISEGKNKQVRRMFEHYGYFVNSLHRTEYGSLKLGPLRIGEFRKLTKEEVENLTRNSKDMKITAPVKPLKEVQESSNGGKKEFKPNLSKEFRDRKNAKRDFKKKFSDDKPREYKTDYKKKFSSDTRAYKGGKKFSDIPKESLRDNSFNKDSKPDFKKKFNTDGPRGGKKDGPRKFTNNFKEKKFDGTKRPDKKKIRRA